MRPAQRWLARAPRRPATCRRCRASVAACRRRQRQAMSAHSAPISRCVRQGCASSSASLQHYAMLAGRDESPKLSKQRPIIISYDAMRPFRGVASRNGAIDRPSLMTVVARRRGCRAPSRQDPGPTMLSFEKPPPLIGAASAMQKAEPASFICRAGVGRQSPTDLIDLFAFYYFAHQRFAQIPDIRRVTIYLTPCLRLLD